MVSYPGQIPGNATIGGTLDVAGAASLEDDLTVDGYTHLTNGQVDQDFTFFAGDAKACTLGSVGGGLAVKEGTNARSGVAALVAGTVTVANTSVTATSRIQVTSQVDGGTPGWLRVSARVNGTSFTITSSSNTDTSTVAWFMVESA